MPQRQSLGAPRCHWEMQKALFWLRAAAPKLQVAAPIWQRVPGHSVRTPSRGATVGFVIRAQTLQRRAPALRPRRQVSRTSLFL